jgi:hypothetical protein
MKKVFPIFSILLLMAIASCGGESTEETVDSASILGDPIKVGNLLVAQNDFPNQMKRKDAVLKENNIQTKGSLLYMGYNAPWDLINRRNEVAFQID